MKATYQVFCSHWIISQVASNWTRVPQFHTWVHSNLSGRWQRDSINNFLLAPFQNSDFKRYYPLPEGQILNERNYMTLEQQPEAPKSGKKDSPFECIYWRHNKINLIYIDFGWILTWWYMTNTQRELRFVLWFFLICLT